jgi:methylmalonyl-CoA/ethylmalonyl-CoA epimerase
LSDTPAHNFDHVALAVRSLRDAARLFRDILGATFVSGGDDTKLNLRSAQYLLPPGTKIELLQPLTEDSGLARFIEKHGEGFHHATFFFNDIETLIPRLHDAGFEVTDTDLSDRGWRETYLRPSSGFGALFQFVDTDLDWSTPMPGITEEAVFAGRVVWEGSTPVLREPEA